MLFRSGGVPADQGWVDLLVAKGYTVDLNFRAQQGRTLDDTKIAALNAADLIIVSRDTDSGQYDDGSEPAQWNGITTPILLQVPHIARSSHWRWLNTTGITNNLPAANPLVAVDPSHPIFNGVTLVANQVSVLTLVSDFASITDPGNGKLIARRADNSQVWIVFWEPGQRFYPTASYADLTPAIAGGPRMFFASGSDEGTDGRYNLTTGGEKLFLNAVDYMINWKQVKATNPAPGNGSLVDATTVALTWKAGGLAALHDVY